MTNIHKKQLYFLLCALLLVPSAVFAGPVVRSGDTISIAADQVLEGDFYGIGGTVSLSGTAEHDVYVAGGSVTINAEVAEDLVIAGGSAQVHAPVGDDVRIVGGDVTIAENVGGDVVVLGGTVKILSTAQVQGDVLFLSGEIDINGGIKGSVVGMGERVRVDAGVGGDLRVTAHELLTLGDRTEILGDVIYKSPSDFARAADAVIVGEITRESFVPDAGPSRYMLLPFLILLFAALTVFLLARRGLQDVYDRVSATYGVNGLLGLGVFLITPLVSTLLLVSVLGIIPGIALLLSYVLLMLVAWIVSGIVLGMLFFRLIGRPVYVSIPAVIVGILLFDLVVLVPYIGFLFAFALFFVVLGSMTRLLYDHLRSMG